MDLLNSSTTEYFLQEQSIASESFMYNSTMFPAGNDSLVKLKSAFTRSISTTNATFLTDQQSPFLQYLNVLAQIMALYFTPIITFAGTIGNILSVLVFFCTKLKKLSSSYYLAALGVSDTGFLLFNFIQWLSFLNIHLYGRDGFCQLFTWLSNACSVLSVWLVVAFTVERFVAVLYPLKRPTLCTVRRARSVLFYLVVISIVNTMPVLLFATSTASLKTNGQMYYNCVLDVNYQVLMRYYNSYDFFVAFLVPLTLIVTLNAITAYTVWKLARIRRTMTTHKRKKGAHLRNSCERQHPMTNFPHASTDIETSEQSMKITSCTHLNGHHSIKQSCPKTHRQRISNSSQMKVTKMLLIVSTVFVLLNLPSYVLRVWIFLAPDPSYNPWFIVMQHISQPLFISNFGINFVLYCMSGQNFRNELIALFRQKSTRKLEVGTQVTVSEYMPSIGPNFSRKRTVTRNVSWNDTYELQVMPAGSSHSN